jgi:tetratricopeptide (TPR) repeat protein
MGPGIVLAILSAPGTAAAQMDGAEALAEARRHMEEGQALYVQGRYVESAQEFLQAHELQGYSAFLYNAAVAYERFGHLGLAATNFERYLRDDPGAPDRAEVEARIARLRAAAAAQSGAPPAAAAATQTAAPAPVPQASPQDIKSMLTVQTNPPGCRIVVRSAGGQVVAQGISPLDSPVDAGEYTLSSTHPDFRPATTDPMPVQPGKVYVVRVEMAQGAFHAFLRVVSNVPGASVFVDERDVGAVGRTPHQNPYPVGHHRIWVEKPGYRTVESEVDLGLGEDLTLRVDLQRVDHGFLDLRANVRGSKVFVDERPVGTAPLDHRLPAGRRVVRVEAEGYKPFEGRVAIERGQRTRVDVRMRPAPSRVPAYVSTGVAATFLGVGIYLGLQADRLYEDLEAERRRGTLATDDPRIMDGFFYSLAADVGFLAATVVGGFAIYYFLRDPLPDSSAEAQRPADLSIAPIGAPGLAAVAIGGTL